MGTHGTLFHKIQEPTHDDLHNANSDDASARFVGVLKTNS